MKVLCEKLNFRYLFITILLTTMTQTKRLSDLPTLGHVSDNCLRSNPLLIIRSTNSKDLPETSLKVTCEYSSNRELWSLELKVDIGHNVRDLKNEYIFTSERSGQNCRF